MNYLPGSNERVRMRPEMAEIATFERVLWGIIVFLKLTLFLLLIYRKNYRVYPCLFTYILLTLLQSPALFVCYRIWGFSSQMSINIAWSTQGLVVDVRALAVAEICRRVLQRCRGIWTLAWRTLLAAAGLVLLYSWAVGRPRWQLAILNADRAFELVIALAIAILFLFVRYYEIEMAPSERLLAIGFFLFSCFSLLNDSILERWLYDYDVLWNLPGTLVFIPCLLLWIWAVRETQPKTVLLPEMLPSAVYLEFAPEINFRLKAVNEHLNQFWSAEARRP
jgi:hypothetical protein